MKKLIWLAFLIISLGVSAFAQSNISVGLHLGSSSYFGDLKPNAFQLNQNSLAFGVNGMYKLSKRLNLRLGLIACTIKAADSKTGKTSLIKRNLSFKSKIFEASLVGEYNFFKLGLNQNKGDDFKRWSPYVFGGLALFGFNPKAELNGEWYNLRELGTEGQFVSNSKLKPYSLTQMSLPFGFGFKYVVNSKLLVALELGWRKTFTDYLDDVSGVYHDLNEIESAKGIEAARLSYRGNELEGFNNSVPPKGSIRGNSDNMDWYILSTFCLTYNLF